MDVYLRIGLLLSAAIILILIFLEPWMKRKRRKVSLSRHSPLVTNFTVAEVPDETHAKIVASDNNILAISVFAKPNCYFVAYDLLQAISAAGMRFGELNIFHFYTFNNDERVKLFSLASATKPGHFNMDRMGDFSCIGLTLFMDLDEVSDPELAFDKMLSTAEQLAEDLDGDLYAAPRRPWTLEMLSFYKQKISQQKTLQYV